VLLIHTKEVTVDFTSFPLSVGLDDDHSSTTTIIIDADERDDGAVPQRLNFTASTEDMRRILREALELIEGA
jgi:hypothetical protein